MDVIAVALVDTPLGDMSNTAPWIGIVFSVVWVLFWLAVILLVRGPLPRPQPACD